MIPGFDKRTKVSRVSDRYREDLTSSGSKMFQRLPEISRLFLSECQTLDTMLLWEVPLPAVGEQLVEHTGEARWARNSYQHVSTIDRCCLADLGFRHVGHTDGIMAWIQ